MLLEKLIEKIPEVHHTKEGDRGLTIRYKLGLKMWVVGYGINFRSNDTQKYLGTGYTILEAVDDFIKNKLNNHLKNEISNRTN